MSKELNISIVIGSVLSLIILVLCIVFGAFTSNQIKFSEPTIIDKTEQTLQIIFGDNVEKLPNYNANYDDLFLPNLVQNSYYKTPNLNSDKYFEFTAWSGSEEVSLTYGMCSVSDWQCQLRDMRLVANSYASKKVFAFQQVSETISLTNVKHISGITDTLFTWANGIGEATYTSSGNLQDIRTFGNCSYFKKGDNWYVLEWARDIEDIVGSLFKGVLKYHLPDFEKDNTSRSVNSNILLNGYCNIYAYDFDSGKKGDETHFNVIAPYKFTYYNTACNDNFVLNQGLKEPIEF